MRSSVSLLVCTAAAGILALTGGLGCRDRSGHEPGDPASSPRIPDIGLPDHISPTFAHGPGWLGTYVSRPTAFNTRSYWIEGPEGVILIDTQLLPSAGVEAVELAEAATGKKVVAAFVLHANPDKFNGTAALQARGIRVLTSRQVAEHIPAVHELRRSWFYDRYKPDYPDQVPAPEPFGAETRELEVAGVTLVLHVMGAGCSEAHVVITYRGHAFVGDLVASLGHAWLELGRLDDWMGRLEEIENLGVEHVHPGRGPSGGPELLARQKLYLERVIGHVQAEDPRADTPAEVEDKALERVAEKIFRDYPGYPFERFVELGLPAVWDREVRRAEARKSAAPAPGEPGRPAAGR